MRKAVIDSSSLINLVHLELAAKLSQYFQVVYVPRRVQVEVNRRSRFRYRLNKLYRTALFQRCVVADEVRVQLLTGPAESELHEGEAEALRIREVARSDAEKIGRAAQMEIVAAERAAKLELKALGARLAVGRAENLLAQQLTPAVQANLFRGFLRELEGSRN